MLFRSQMGALSVPKPEESVDLEARRAGTTRYGWKRETRWALIRIAALVLTGLCCGVTVGLILSTKTDPPKVVETQPQAGPGQVKDIPPTDAQYDGHDPMLMEEPLEALEEENESEGKGGPWRKDLQPVTATGTPKTTGPAPEADNPDHYLQPALAKSRPVDQSVSSLHRLVLLARRVQEEQDFEKVHGRGKRQAEAEPHPAGTRIPIQGPRTLSPIENLYFQKLAPGFASMTPQLRADLVEAYDAFATCCPNSPERARIEFQDVYRRTHDLIPSNPHGEPKPGTFKIGRAHV